MCTIKNDTSLHSCDTAQCHLQSWATPAELLEVGSCEQENCALCFWNWWHMMHDIGYLFYICLAWTLKTWSAHSWKSGHLSSSLIIPLARWRPKPWITISQHLREGEGERKWENPQSITKISKYSAIKHNISYAMGESVCVSFIKQTNGNPDNLTKERTKSFHWQLPIQAYAFITFQLFSRTCTLSSESVSNYHSIKPWQTIPKQVRSPQHWSIFCLASSSTKQCIKSVCRCVHLLCTTFMSKQATSLVELRLYGLDLSVPTFS